MGSKDLKRLKKIFSKQIDQATELKADLTAAEALNWIPINTGNLRRSQEVRQTGEAEFEIRIGEGIAYAKAHYFGFEKRDGPGHIFESGQPVRILDRFAPETTGQTDTSRYQNAYRQAKESGLIVSKFDGALEWYVRVLESPGFKERARNVFIKKLNEGIREL